MAKILVIDDDAIMRDTLLRRLKPSGHEVSSAQDAAGGLAAFRGWKPEIVLLDIHLPDSDGLSVLAAIKTEAPGTAVIMITGQADVKTSVQALRKGAFDYLLKPFEREELDICVQRALRGMEMERRLKEAQAQLIQSEKMSALGQLAAGIAHEVNNPLTAVCMNAALLLENAKDERQVRLLKTIEKEADRAAAIVRSVLLFSRKSKGDKKEPADLNAAISEILLPVEGQLALRNIMVVRELATDLPRAELDVNQMQQVFVNLINNARDAMPGGGTLTIRTSRGARSPGQADSIIAEFSDTGSGIRPENLGRLFVPFFTTKDPGKGVGLGLYITRTIVANHGGTIEAANGPAGGATFRICLPAAVSI
ncbi:MAG: response regulator [Elusimicrobiota bacterium]|nr:response regulator [Elusimicrobiota bacterium]